MNATKIQDSDIESLKISSLPTRPTAPTNFGGSGFTAAQMQAAFDALPLYIVDAYNTLIDDIGGIGSNSIATEVKTGIAALPTLYDLFGGVTDGSLADEITVSGRTLSAFLSDLNSRLSYIESLLGI